ncbi:MAG: DUF2383 domain-containing protein [Bdellovibrionales bacterium]|nr:DUF2383 domain-containing protein [Bdellovibrionales bacterium]
MEQMTYGERLQFNGKVGKVEHLQKVLRGEVSATESYDRAKKMFSKNRIAADKLEQIRYEHEEAVRFWQKHILDEGVDIDTSSGAWGAVVEGFVATAKLFGEDLTTSALLTGEEYGLKEYKDILEDENIDRDTKSFVSEVLIPRQKRHINILKTIKH